MIDGILGKGDRISLKISTFVITCDRRLVRDFVIYGSMVKGSVIVAVSTIRDFVITGASIL